MKWLFWNIRGVNKRYKQKEVREYIRSNKIKLVGLVETKVKEENAQKISKYITSGWDILTNYREAKNGRVWLLWDTNHLMVTRVRDDPQMIHYLVQSRKGDIKSYLTVVYGFNGLEQRRELWKNLQQIATTGEYYTWTNRQPGVDKVSSRIDRVFRNYEWMMNWNHVETIYDLPQISDHTPMLLTLASSSWTGKVPFRFFNAWTNHQEFIQIMTEVWNTKNSTGTMKSIWYKLKALKAPLKALNVKEFKGIKLRIEAARMELKDIQEQLSNKYSDSLLKREKETLLNLENWSMIEENILQQKARAKWIQLGDDNTKYFTAVMKDRSQRKQINEITERYGDRVTDPEGITEEILDFYKSLMGSTTRSLLAINRLYMSNSPRLTQQQRKDLCADVTDQEILESLKAIGNDKAPDVADQEILESLKAIGDDKAPGIDGYNVVFFKKSWSIISKQVMKEIGFPDKFIKWIMECIKSISYTVLINGETTKPFEATKGLRQGDPISPFLFAIVMEYLSRSFIEMGKDKLFQYHPRCKKLGITHLSFADDLLLFSRGDLTSISTLHQYFSQFSKASGLQANMGSNTISRKSYVAWDKMCTPKSTGGMNIINLMLWNKAAIAKICWDLAHKEKLWIRWINAYYIKHQQIQTMPIPKQASWMNYGVEYGNGFRKIKETTAIGNIIFNGSSRKQKGNLTRPTSADWYSQKHPMHYVWKEIIVSLKKDIVTMKV
ncbi:uncharacterized protein LOC142161947 [Nicotiana tabacum]|uniref:Uncharacterized protein LOC142161947 n=1 Tax=Nicotiana tabacum TaxID=4097 RepID=A0AC58RNJ4_TOBAC